MSEIRILIVSGRESERNALAEIVGDGERQLLFAEGADEALFILQGNPSDLLLVAADLGDVDGLHLCEQVRALPTVGSVPVLIVDETPDREAQLRALASGADGIVPVPLDEKLIQAHVDAIVRNNRCRRIHELSEKLVVQNKRLEFLESRDQTTGLPNLALFKGTLAEQLEKARSAGYALSVMAIDVEGIEVITEGLGDAVGELLLRAVGNRLLSKVRPNATVARTGEASFGILQPLPSPEFATQLAQDTREALKEPFRVADKKFNVTSNIGISVYPDDASKAHNLLAHAITAKSLARQQGKNQCQYYSSEMNKHAQQRVHLEYQLREALERDQFLLYYQPRVDLTTNRYVCAEALLRWNHPEYGVIAPDRFLDIAEETGLIEPIGDWVLRTACHQARVWIDSGAPVTRVAVNLSGKEFGNHSLYDKVAAALSDNQLTGDALELELAEDLMIPAIEGGDVIDTLRQLSRLNVGLSIDDFGTGYSSLAHLKRLPISALKIDRSFLHDVPFDDENAAIVSAIVDLAHNLKLGVVAEGLESDAQLRFLVQRGCEHAQGYLFAAPMPAEALARFVAEKPPLADAPTRKATGEVQAGAG